MTIFSTPFTLYLYLSMYADSLEVKDLHQSFIHIVVENVPGVLARITNLMRKRSYNMDEVSVSFGDEDKAYIDIAIDASKHDVEQVARQIDKLYNVIAVTLVPATAVTHAFYVYTHAEDFFGQAWFSPIQKKETEKMENVLVFIISNEDVARFTLLLKTHFLHYKRRMIAVL